MSSTALTKLNGLVGKKCFHHSGERVENKSVSAESRFLVKLSWSENELFLKLLIHIKILNQTKWICTFYAWLQKPKKHHSLVFRNGIVDSISVWYHWRWGSRCHSRKSTKASGHCKVPVSTTAWNNEWIRLFFYLSKKGTPCLNSNPLSWNNFGVWPRVILAAMASPNKCLSQPRPCLHSFISLAWHLTASWYNPCKVCKNKHRSMATRCWYFFI